MRNANTKYNKKQKIKMHKIRYIEQNAYNAINTSKVGT